MDAKQFRIFVAQPALRHIGLWSEAAEELIMGTAAHESAGLRYIDQVTGPGDVTLGPAFGLMQIEAATHKDLWENYLSYRSDLADRIRGLMTAEEPRFQLVTNLSYAVAMARLVYYRHPDPLPADHDLAGQAAIWKKVYNTIAGAGTEVDFMRHYRMYVRE